MTSVVDKTRTTPSRYAAAAETSTEAAGRAASDTVTIPAELLDGGEVVLLAIKPSLWFIIFDSARWLVLGAALLIVAATGSLSLGWMSSRMVAQVACLFMVGRLAAALLRWVSRFYVLTNRRVMRMRGVFQADILSCPLVKIRNTRVTVGIHERMTRLGTILFVTEEMPGSDLHWYQIAKVEEVHARVRRAIERAIDSQPHR